MFVEFRGRKVLPRISAARELEFIGIDLFDVVEVLENGFDCASGGNRRQGIEEKCLLVGGKVLRVVIAEGLFGLAGAGGKEDVYYLIHVSIESPKKGRFK